MATITPLSGIIMEDGAYQLKIGGVWDGSAPAFGVDVYVMNGILKEATITQKVSKTRVSAAGVRNRYHSGEDELTIKSFTPAAGSVIAADGLARGKWVQISTDTFNTADDPVVVQGVITDFKHSISQGEPVFEDITIDLMADHA